MKYSVILILMAFNAMAEVKMNDQCGLQTQVAKESRLSNKIKWKTASEQDNFGYDIYRANSKEGEYKIINEDTIEGAGTTSTSRSYVYLDDSIDPCKQYYYYIESIAMDGTREAFTPKFQSKLKINKQK